MAEPSNRSARSWVLTLNNFTEKEWKELTTLTEISYGVFGRERGDNDTPHIQGAVTLKKSVRLSWWKKRCPRAHLEVMQARAEGGRKAFEYCKKENDFVVIDNRARTKEASSKRETLTEWVEAFKAGTTLGELIQQDPVTAAAYHKPLEWLALKLVKPRTVKPYVIWLYGPSGVGKSTRVLDEVGVQAYWHKCDSFKWWSLYTGQQDVVLEELRGGHATLNELLRLLDFTPLAVETKGGHMQMRATKVYVTTPFAPTRIFRDEDGARHEAIGQLRRRVDEVYECYCDVEGNYCCEDKTEELQCGKFYQVERRGVVNIDLSPMKIYDGDKTW